MRMFSMFLILMGAVFFALSTEALGVGASNLFMIRGAIGSVLILIGAAIIGFLSYKGYYD